MKESLNYYCFIQEEKKIKRNFSNTNKIKENHPIKVKNDISPLLTELSNNKNESNFYNKDLYSSESFRKSKQLENNLRVNCTKINKDKKKSKTFSKGFSSSNLPSYLNINDKNDVSKEVNLSFLNFINQKMNNYNINLSKNNHKLTSNTRYNSIDKIANIRQESTKAYIKSKQRKRKEGIPYKICPAFSPLESVRKERKKSNKYNQNHGQVFLIPKTRSFLFNDRPNPKLNFNNNFFRNEKKELNDLNILKFDKKWKNICQKTNKNLINSSDIQNIKGKKGISNHINIISKNNHNNKEKCDYNIKTFYKGNNKLISSNFYISWNLFKRCKKYEEKGKKDLTNEFRLKINKEIPEKIAAKKDRTLFISQ